MLKTRHNDYNTIRMQVVPYRERAVCYENYSVCFEYWFSRKFEQDPMPKTEITSRDYNAQGMIDSQSFYEDTTSWKYTYQWMII